MLGGHGYGSIEALESVAEGFLLLLMASRRGYYKCASTGWRLQALGYGYTRCWARMRWASSRRTATRYRRPWANREEAPLDVEEGGPEEGEARTRCRVVRRTRAKKPDQDAVYGGVGDGGGSSKPRSRTREMRDRQEHFF